MARMHRPHMSGRFTRSLRVAAAIAVTAIALASTAAAASPRCDGANALQAARDSAIPYRFHRAWPSFPSFGHLGYATWTVLCRQNLMGTGARGMVALLRCCTVSSPTALGVFEAKRGRWHLVYSQVRRLVWQTKFGGTDLIEKTPVYSFPHDADCCPSHFQYYRLRWTHSRFRTIRGHLVHG